jgi:tetratricopeptide (TPR) repeat protein
MTVKHFGWFLVLNLTLGWFSSRGQSVELAKDYYKHGVADKAKDILISTAHDKSATPASKAEALYVLGQISFEQNHYSVALDDWQRLIKTYPQSIQAKEISDRLTQLKDVMSKSSDEELSSAVASSYLHNGDFWSHSKRIYTIDSSYLPEVEMSIFWYDKLIKEFPSEAEVGYQRKLFALLGWGDTASQEKTGARADFPKYIPQLIETFSRFEKDFPDNSSLQPFRLMIAQQYWYAGPTYTVQAKGWFTKIVDASNGVETFYTRCAKERLQHLQ